MTPDRLQQVWAIYDAALAHQEPGRSAFLADACGGDDSLRREVELLLQPTVSAANLPTDSTIPASNSSRPALLTGRRLGVYQVEAHLGTGGMGEVYRARDTRLRREVAIKILPAAFTNDPDRLAQFEREARVLASLNHPGIAAIYGLEETDGVRALVLELVDGGTLADRMARGPLPVNDAIKIARQIADALEAAHDKGIIHRDLKPGNVALAADGTVKVLDFGLAKAVAPSGVTPLGRELPTMTMAATREGTILGTPGYMSPEQARGQVVDKRTDVWGFGCVLHEMLTGKMAFSGRTVADTLAAVLEREPDWSTLPEATPPGIRRLLRRCLEKDLKNRLRDIGDARLELEDSTSAPASASIPSARSGRVPWIMAAGSVLVAAFALLTWLNTATPTPPVVEAEMRTQIVTPDTRDPASFALSPDGRQIVFVGDDSGVSRLWLRSFSRTTAQPLQGTDNALRPFWSPDNRSIGFFADGQLKRLDLDGGSPRPLTRVSLAGGGTWNATGDIVFSPTIGSLSRVSADGGETRVVAALGPSQYGGSPVFLPDNRHFVYWREGTTDTSGIYLGTLDGTEATLLTPADSGGTYVPPGWLMWVRGGTLVAQRLDLTRRSLSGETVTLDQAVTARVGSSAPVSASASGIIAYRPRVLTRRQLTWFDRTGRQLGTIGDSDDADLNWPRLSPDASRVAASRRVQDAWALWLLDGVRRHRQTFDRAGGGGHPEWSPDGQQVVFGSPRSGPYDLYVTSIGSGTETLLVHSENFKAPSSWSRDGRFFLYHSIDGSSRGDIWLRPMDGDAQQPCLLMESPDNEAFGRFSPDGRWVAYQSNRSGQTEIYVQPFNPDSPCRPTSGAESVLVSTGNASYPMWGPGGRELYYLAPSGDLMAVPLNVSAGGLKGGAPAALFRTRIVGGGASQGGRQYDVAADGRFLINTVVGDTSASPITLIQHWQPPASKP